MAITSCGWLTFDPLVPEFVAALSMTTDPEPGVSAGRCRPIGRGETNDKQETVNNEREQCDTGEL